MTWFDANDPNDTKTSNYEISNEGYIVVKMDDLVAIKALEKRADYISFMMSYKGDPVLLIDFKY